MVSAVHAEWAVNEQGNVLAAIEPDDLFSWPTAIILSQTERLILLTKEIAIPLHIPDEILDHVSARANILIVLLRNGEVFDEFYVPVERR